MKTTIFLFLMVISINLQAQRYTDIVKFQPLATIANSVTFEWEHIEGRKSLIVAIGLPVDGEAKKDWFNAPSNLHTSNIMAGLRLYATVKKRAYIQPFAKCQTIDWCSELKQGKTDGYLFTTSAGISIGYQVVFKHFIFDFYPLGLEFGRVNGDLKTYSGSRSDGDYMYSYINNFAEKLPRNPRLDISRNGNEFTADLAPTTFFWLRSGFSIGYKFQKNPR